MPTEDNDEYHQYEIDKVDGEKVFPFKSKQLVDTETGECPFEPDDDE